MCEESEKKRLHEILLFLSTFLWWVSLACCHLIFDDGWATPVLVRPVSLSLAKTSHVSCWNRGRYFFPGPQQQYIRVHRPPSVT